MANKEALESTNQGADWDSLKAPVEVIQPTKDAEYYRNNLDKVGDLASELLDLRAASNEPKEKVDIDSHGWPTRWSHLSRFMRKNPDVIDSVYAECERLRGIMGESSTGEVVEDEEPVEKMPDEVVEDDVAVAEEGVASDGTEPGVAESEYDNTYNSGAGELSISDFDEMTTSQQLSKISESIDSVAGSEQLSELWKKMARSLDGSSPAVKAKVNYLRAEAAIELSKKFIKSRQDELRSMGLFKRFSSRAKTLKGAIESTKKSVEFNESKLVFLRNGVSNEMSDEENALVDQFRHLDERMARMNDDIHIRKVAKSIKMYERWIGDQEKFMADEKAAGKTDDEISFERRRKQIADWRDEIDVFRQEIADYQKIHPDFVVDPTEAVATEQKQAA